jgi:hypothetical protein
MTAAQPSRLTTPATGDHATAILPLKPIALEGLDHLLIEYMKVKGQRGKNLALLPEGKGFLADVQTEATPLSPVSVRVLVSDASAKRR